MRCGIIVCIVLFIIPTIPFVTLLSLYLTQDLPKYTTARCNITNCSLEVYECTKQRPCYDAHLVLTLHQNRRVYSRARILTNTARDICDNSLLRCYYRTENPAETLRLNKPITSADGYLFGIILCGILMLFGPVGLVLKYTQCRD